MSVSLSLQQCAFTLALAKLIIKINETGYQVKIQELNRILETQKEYVAKGVSWTLDSRHLDKLAADIVLFKDGAMVEDQNSYRQFGEYWEGVGGRWGGRFGLEKEPKEVQATKLGRDCPHFEMRKT